MPVAPPDTVLASFTEATRAAERAEEDFRKGFNERLQKLERERAFAYRRQGLITEICTELAGKDNPDEARRAVREVLLREFGLDPAREAHQPILAAFEAVTDALLAATGRIEAERPIALPDALSTFEHWYEAHTGSPFMALYDVYVPVTPVVDY